MTRPFFIAVSAFGRKCNDHDTEESCRKRDKPLVPKYQLRDPKFFQSVNESCSLQFHPNACFSLYHECVQRRTQLSRCLSSYVSISHGDKSGEVLARGAGGLPYERSGDARGKFWIKRPKGDQSGRGPNLFLTPKSDHFKLWLHESSK